MKKLEDLLNLPESKKIIEESKDIDDNSDDDFSHIRNIEDFDKITAALPAVKGLGEMADKELNDVANRAMDAYDELMDLGMNVESRYSGRIFEVANAMLKTGLDAKVAKIDKKLKMVELQLRKEKQDKDSSGSDGQDFVNGEGYVVADRNSLIERLKGLDKDK